jgi:hypothetical protein
MSQSNRVEYLENGHVQFIVIGVTDAYVSGLLTAGYVSGKPSIFVVNGQEIDAGTYTNAIVPRLPNGLYASNSISYCGWWLKYNHGRILVKYEDDDFIPGFMALFTARAEEFRHKIIGPPFKLEKDGQEVVQCNIDGFDIEPYYPEEGNDEEAAPGPYFTGSYETDNYGADYE